RPQRLSRACPCRAGRAAGDKEALESQEVLLQYVVAAHPEQVADCQHRCRVGKYDLDRGVLAKVVRQPGLSDQLVQQVMKYVYGVAVSAEQAQRPPGEYRRKARCHGVLCNGY